MSRIEDISSIVNALVSASIFVAGVVYVAAFWVWS
jgi:hypothetical protein